MGLTVRVGQIDIRRDEGIYRMRVARECSRNAPSFPNDPCDGLNERWPSYPAWHESMTLLRCRFVWNERPVVYAIDEMDLESLKREVLALRDKHAGIEPGFTEYVEFPDTNMLAAGVLARAIWLEWWCTWAMEHCSHPGVELS